MSRSRRRRRRPTYLVHEDTYVTTQAQAAESSKDDGP
jgi:hypothetical protein